MSKVKHNTFPSTGLFDLVRLLGGFSYALFRHPSSVTPGLILCEWIWGLVRRRKSEAIVVNLFFKKVLLVTGKEFSMNILEGPPSTQSYTAGRTKVNGMSFLAPKGLTICDDDKWRRLRPLNEQVLDIGASRELQQATLDAVDQAFSEPVSNINDLRNCMGKVMLGVVFGGAPAHLAEDVNVLFDYVQNPVKRKIFGPKQRGRRDRFYSTINHLLEDNDRPLCPHLMERAHALSAGEDLRQDELAQQIPHWMFTFTASGTALLSRTLAMVGSRTDVMGRVRDEIDSVGPLDQPSSIGRLRFVEACIFETGRLFPPVTKTVHVALKGEMFHEYLVPPGMEIFHYFPANNRNNEFDPLANHFKPERWLDPGSGTRLGYPNLFLSGARACPGEDLILFVCKAAIAFLTEQQRLRLVSDGLAIDPLPFEFPEKSIRLNHN